MSGNTFGKIFTVTTFGESHGPAIGAVVDGCPAGLHLSEKDIQEALDRRKPGQSRITSQRRESDTIKILSGVFEGFTTGAPIGLLIENEDMRARDYENLKEVFRPGHADFTYHHKYGHRDYRGGGRASARETAMRVAAGAIAKKYLQEKYHLEIRGAMIQMGDIKAAQMDWQAVNQNPFFFPDISQLKNLEEKIIALREAGDSIGALVQVEAIHVPIGFGEPVFDRLDAELAKAFMSIPAVKGVEIGAGFGCVTQKGSEHRDEITPEGFLSNHAGGILGGISSGQPMIARLAFKPASSIRIPGKSINVHHKAVEVMTTGRHDPCVGIRGVPVAEAMMALVLMDAALKKI